MVDITKPDSEWLVEARRRAIEEVYKFKKREHKVSLYNIDIHVPMLFDSIGKGESQAHFCSRAGIGKSCFLRWLRDPEKAEFRFAYELAQMMGEAIITDLSLYRTDLHHQYLKVRMASLHRSAVLALEGLTSDSLETRLAGLRKSLDDGQIEIDEYGKLLSATLQEVRMAQITNLLGKLVKPEDFPIDEMNAQQLVEYVKSVAEIARN